MPNRMIHALTLSLSLSLSHSFPQPSLYLFSYTNNHSLQGALRYAEPLSLSLKVGFFRGKALSSCIFSTWPDCVSRIIKHNGSIAQKTFLVSVLLSIFLKKMDQPRPLFKLFAVFSKQTIQFLRQINVKMSCASRIQHRDSNL